MRSVRDSVPNHRHQMESHPDGKSASVGISKNALPHPANTGIRACDAMIKGTGLATVLQAFTQNPSGTQRVARRAARFLTGRHPSASVAIGHAEPRSACLQTPTYSSHSHNYRYTANLPLLSACKPVQEQGHPVQTSRE